MSADIASDILVTLLSPDSTFDQRKAAILRLAEESWSRGWDECEQATQEALALVTPPQSDLVS